LISLTFPLSFSSERVHGLLLTDMLAADKREFLRISQAVGMGFLIMGVIGYIVKLSKSEVLSAVLSFILRVGTLRNGGLANESKRGEKRAVMEMARQGICFRVQRANILSPPQSTSPSTTSWSEALKRIVAQQLRDAFGVLGSSAGMARNERYAFGLSVWRGARFVKPEGGQDKHVQKRCPRNLVLPQERRSCMHKSGQACRPKAEDRAASHIRTAVAEATCGCRDGQSICLSDANDRGSGDGSGKPHTTLDKLSWW
jgi:hypothetical protein